MFSLGRKCSKITAFFEDKILAQLSTESWMTRTPRALFDTHWIYTLRTHVRKASTSTLVHANINTESTTMAITILISELTATISTKHGAHYHRPGPTGLHLFQTEGQRLYNKTI